MSIFLILAIIALIGSVVTVGYSRRKRAAIRRAAKAQAELASKFSWAARQAMESFNSLPEQHRPAYDVEAAVKALDVKHGKEEVDVHFTTSNRYLLTPYKSFKCSCVWDYWEEKRTADKCNHYPEYQEIIDAANSITSALAAQEQAIKDREHRMVLAGIENDLNSVKEITAALRMEKSLINQVTKEIE